MEASGEIALHESRGCLIAALQHDLHESEIEALGEQILERLARARLHAVVLDLAGVPLLDLTVARRIAELTRAVRLLGARALLSGLRPGPAAALARLGFDAAGLELAGDLDAALARVAHRSPAAGAGEPRRGARADR